MLTGCVPEAVKSSFVWAEKFNATLLLFFLTFHTVHGVIKARILCGKWFAILFFSGPHFVKTHVTFCQSQHR